MTYVTVKSLWIHVFKYAQYTSPKIDSFKKNHKKRKSDWWIIEEINSEIYERIVMINA